MTLPIRVFIASSSEHLDVANTIRNRLLRGGTVDPKVWNEGTFKLSKTYIESLEGELQVADFAVLTLTSDDVSIARREVRSAPRDNVLFELGLFMGATRSRSLPARHGQGCARKDSVRPPGDQDLDVSGATGTQSEPEPPGCEHRDHESRPRAGCPAEDHRRHTSPAEADPPVLRPRQGRLVAAQGSQRQALAVVLPVRPPTRSPTRSEPPGPRSTIRVGSTQSGAASPSAFS